MLKPEFAVLRFGPRYDRAEVDAFVERVLAAGRGLAHQPLDDASQPLDRGQDLCQGAGLGEHRPVAGGEFDQVPGWRIELFSYIR